MRHNGNRQQDYQNECSKYIFDTCLDLGFLNWKILQKLYPWFAQMAVHMYVIIENIDTEQNWMSYLKIIDQFCQLYSLVLKLSSTSATHRELQIALNPSKEIKCILQSAISSTTVVNALDFCYSVANMRTNEAWKYMLDENLVQVKEICASDLDGWSAEAFSYNLCCHYSAKKIDLQMTAFWRYWMSYSTGHRIHCCCWRRNRKPLWKTRKIRLSEVLDASPLFAHLLTGKYVAYNYIRKFSETMALQVTSMSTLQTAVSLLETSAVLLQRLKTPAFGELYETLRNLLLLCIGVDTDLQSATHTNVRGFKHDYCYRDLLLITTIRFWDCWKDPFLQKSRFYTKYCVHCKIYLKYILSTKKSVKNPVRKLVSLRAYMFW